MHIEVQVALNFVISYLYNKLPRRRVNIFGEELEKALKEKFKGHWYPEKPFKGSAFRCLKTGDPVDPVLEKAAKESGVPIQDVLENLPQELAVWVDPGEVSYRIGEKGAVKVLFSESADPQDESSADREVTKTFNPEAQCFRPIDAVGCSLSGLSLSPKAMTPFNSSANGSVVTQLISSVANGGPVPNGNNANGKIANAIGGHLSSPSSGSSPTPLGSYKGSPSPVPSFIPRTTAPLTFTTATFAQTKFGSTKLKTSSKRANRMSPTEFSNYIKQRAMQQQIHHHHHPGHHQGGMSTQPQTSPTGRSLSPNQLGGAGNGAGGPHAAADPNAYFFQHGPYHPQFPHRNMFESSSQFLGAADLYPGNNTGSGGSKYPFEHTPLSQFYPGAANGGNGAGIQNSGPAANNNAANGQDNGKLLDGLNSFGLGSVGPYPASQYQHLLVAN